VAAYKGRFVLRRKEEVMKTFAKDFSRMDRLERSKIMIFPFLLIVSLLREKIYPLFGNEHERYFFAMLAGLALSILVFWIIEGLEHLFLKRGETVMYPNLPYDLFYHYKLKNINSAGCIYLVKRLSDGVYKIGKAANLDDRIRALRREYGPMSSVAAWEVSDLTAYERNALERTKQFIYPEMGRNELRKMDNLQSWQFVTEFTQFVVDIDLGFETIKTEEAPRQVSLVWLNNDSLANTENENGLNPNN
jgi:hypothetical protein